jgi:predicted TIM-barrel fold metal-dependent hydrolase
MMFAALSHFFTTRAHAQLRGTVTSVDTHAHIFARSLKFAGDRRYTPDYDATLDDYLRVLDTNAISHGVLIQPSFLGTDNSDMTAALRQCPARLRGIAVVEPTIGEQDLAALAAAGVVGIRLNSVGSAAPDLTSNSWLTLLRKVARLQWQVEVQKEARDLPAMIPALLDVGLNVVVDHFGRPDPRLGIEDPGFQFLLSTATSRKVWVKLSGAYRNGADGLGEKIAQQAVPLLRHAFGSSRLLWGSDWPHTQFEKTASFAATRKQLDEWIQDPAERRRILVDTPVELFRF